MSSGLVIKRARKKESARPRTMDHLEKGIQVVSRGDLRKLGRGQLRGRDRQGHGSVQSDDPQPARETVDGERSLPVHGSEHPGAPRRDAAEAGRRAEVCDRALFRYPRLHVALGEDAARGRGAADAHLPEPADDRDPPVGKGRRQSSRAARSWPSSRATVRRSARHGRPSRSRTTAGR